MKNTLTSLLFRVVVIAAVIAISSAVWIAILDPEKATISYFTSTVYLLIVLVFTIVMTIGYYVGLRARDDVLENSE